MGRMRVVVMGGSGFLGGHLLAALRAHGATARADLFSVGLTGMEPLVPCAVVTGDRRAPGFVERLVADIRPDLWFDLAVYTAHDAAALVDAWRRIPTAARVVVAGSVAEYGDLCGASVPVSPDAPLLGTGSYAEGKIAAWNVCREAHARHGFPVFWGVLPQLWGPHDTHGRDCLFGRRILSGRPVILRGNGRTLLPDGFAATVAEGLVHAATIPESAGTRANVAGPGRLTPLRFVSWTAAALGLRPRVRHLEPMALAESQRAAGWTFATPFSDCDCALDTSWLQRHGFTPRRTARQGVVLTARWHRDAQSAPARRFEQQQADDLAEHGTLTTR